MWNFDKSIGDINKDNWTNDIKGHDSDIQAVHVATRYAPPLSNVIRSDTDRLATYDFLLVVHSSYGPKRHFEWHHLICWAFISATSLLTYYIRAKAICLMQNSHPRLASYSDIFNILASFL